MNKKDVFNMASSSSAFYHQSSVVAAMQYNVRTKPGHKSDPDVANVIIVMERSRGHDKLFYFVLDSKY